MILSRRSLLTGFATLLAAPAIVRASSLMHVSPWEPKPRRVNITSGDLDLVRFVDGKVERMGGWQRYAGDGSREAPFATLSETIADIGHRGGGTVMLLN